MSIALLKLMQLADSAAPIGGAAHSMGLETAIEERGIGVDGLPRLLSEWLRESAALDAYFCRIAYTLPEYDWLPGWIAINDEVSATKPARESRIASSTLGRRYLTLAAGLEKSDRLHAALNGARLFGCEIHHCTAFGLAAAVFGVDSDSAVQVYLQQCAAALVSAAQRLLPLGQNRASQILWDLKPILWTAAQQCERPPCFMPSLEIASMRHPDLPTRLFVS